MIQTQKVPPVFETNVASDITIVADQEAFFADAATPTHPPHRWIQAKYITRLTKVLAIRDRELHVEEITGAAMALDEVVDIFNRVNSGGTKLSKGDLALARICATWPEARDTMNAKLGEWRESGFHFRLDWLLRVTNAVLTGEAEFTALRVVDRHEFERA